MQTKRSFIALLSSVLCLRSTASSQSDEPKALREREVNLKANHQSLKDYYLELITKDAEIRKLFQKIEKRYELYGDAHYGGPGSPIVIKWFPSFEEWGNKENHDSERFLVMHPLEWGRSRYAMTDEAIISEFECVTTHFDDAQGKQDYTKAVYRFLGFRKMKLEPLSS